MKRQAVQNCILLIVMTTLAGCATIVHGPKQDIRVNSEPIGATVFVNNDEQGTTPVVLTLRRNERYLLRLELDGYASSSQLLARSADPWALVGGVFTGPISLGIDWASGALYILKPDRVFVRLEASSTDK